MPLRNIMKRIKIGKYYILDECGDLSLKEYQPVKVKIIKRFGGGYYGVMPIEPVVFPVMDDGWAIKNFRVHKRYLTPTTPGEKIVIRCPINMPKFSRADDLALTKIYDSLKDGKEITDQDILRLKIILHKIRYSINLFDGVNL